MIAKSSYVVKKPSTLTNEEFAPFLCAGITSYKALKECNIIAGQTVGIIGAAGGLGSYAIQYAKAMGFKPIAIDLPNKLEFCKKLGAETVDVTNLSSIQNSCHAVIVLAASLKAYSQSIDLVKRNGKIIFVSLPEGKFELEPAKVVFNRLTLKGSLVGTREDMKEALEFAERGLVKSYIETDSFDKIDDIFQRLRNNDITGRMVVKFDN
jgi:propanol-preferring alcohol dehydrogenase